MACEIWKVKRLKHCLPFTAMVSWFSRFISAVVY